MRTIKKYPNRRLYDTEVSRYITVSDLRQLIIEGEEFEVVDVASGDDLTRMVLLQIINEQESGGQEQLPPGVAVDGHRPVDAEQSAEQPAGEESDLEGEGEESDSDSDSHTDSAYPYDYGPMAK